VAYYQAFPITGRLACLYRSTVLRHTRIAAITGSYGKTTTRMVTSAALGDLAPYHRSRPAEAIFQIPVGHPHAVFELGIDGPGQMLPKARAIRPDVAAVTTIGSEHFRSLKTLEGTREEKAHLVRVLGPKGLAVLNGDDPHVLWMASQTRAQVRTFGLGDTNDVRATGIELDWPRGIRFVIHAPGQAPQSVSTRFLGRHFVLVFLAAAAIATAEGVTLPDFADRVRDLEPVHGRMHTVTLPSGAVLLCDYFKGSYETMHAALDTLAEAPARRKIVVFGNIDSPPGSPAQTYGVLGERAGQIADQAIFVGNSFQPFRAGAVRGGMAKSAVVDAGLFVLKAAEALGELGEGDVVLIKGRGDQRLDRIALALQGRRVACGILKCELKAVRCNGCSQLGSTPVGDVRPRAGSAAPAQADR
jgi:UDP-N-acetylmuramoyl-tripeptide--D-alanyl-D-alanine ligase